MGEFFKGWRRKFGALTLVLACVFTAGWVRSCGVEDRLAFTIGDLRHAIGSVNGKLLWEHWLNQKHEGGVDWSTEALGSDVSKRFLPAFYVAPPDQILGKLKFEMRTIPYWYIATPLTLISLLLLLWSPRKISQNKVDQPVPHEETES